MAQLPRKMCLKMEMKYNWKHKLNTPNKHCKVKKPTTLQANGLSQIESQELRLGWKSIMLGLSGLWYKDQKKWFFNRILRCCVKLPDWVLHGRNQSSSLEVWDWISSDQNHYQIKEFSDSQDSDANWCQDRNNAFQKKYCPTSVTFPIEILM